jgi:hypothetical protein
MSTLHVPNVSPVQTTTPALHLCRRENTDDPHIPINRRSTVPALHTIPER